MIKTCPLVHGKAMPMFGGGADLREFTLDSPRSFGNGALVRTYSGKR